jgi:hypothetical protein
VGEKVVGLQVERLCFHQAFQLAGWEAGKDGHGTQLVQQGIVHAWRLAVDGLGKLTHNWIGLLSGVKSF